jgi:hypothetical protein
MLTTIQTLMVVTTTRSESTPDRFREPDLQEAEIKWNNADVAARSADSSTYYNSGSGSTYTDPSGNVHKK